MAIWVLKTLRKHVLDAYSDLISKPGRKWAPPSSTMVFHGTLVKNHWVRVKLFIESNV